MFGGVLGCFRKKERFKRARPAVSRAGSSSFLLGVDLIRTPKFCAGLRSSKPPAPAQVGSRCSREQPGPGTRALQRPREPPALLGRQVVSAGSALVRFSPLQTMKGYSSTFIYIFVVFVIHGSRDHVILIALQVGGRRLRRSVQLLHSDLLR